MFVSFAFSVIRSLGSCVFADVSNASFPDEPDIECLWGSEIVAQIPIKFPSVNIDCARIIIIGEFAIVEVRVIQAELYSIKVSHVLDKGAGSISWVGFGTWVFFEVVVILVSGIDYKGIAVLISIAWSSFQNVSSISANKSVTASISL